MTALAELLGIATDLGPDELAVVLEVARGLRAGRAMYGELEVATDSRDMGAEAGAEAGDELRDALVYVGAALLRLRSCGTP